MGLGEILVGRGLVSLATVHAALERQRRDGGRLGDILVKMGAMTADQFASVKATIESTTPPAPRSIADTGIAQAQLSSLMLKFMLVEARSAPSEIAHAMRLPYQLVQELIADATHRRLVHAAVTNNSRAFQDIPYTLSQEGRTAAADALRQCQYLGPAPVPLQELQQQIRRQPIGGERVTADQLRDGLQGMVVPDYYIRKILPAINAGRTILLYGPPGNGKTTVASRIASLFRDVVYVPYAFEVAGQIIKVFDANIHRPAVSDEERGSLDGPRLGIDPFDDRWVACRRPFAFAGGELTWEMLDLQFDSDARFYDAPLHIKAMNGVFLIDDFGRQRIEPDLLLNRWISPLEQRVDYLRLHTGISFSVPFDTLLMFSTNIEQGGIMDPALLRRIGYKIRLEAPRHDEFRDLFMAEAASHGLAVADDVIDFLLKTLTEEAGPGLAYFQPKFICAQAVEFCQAFDLVPRVTKALVMESLSNLYWKVENADAPPASERAAPAGRRGAPRVDAEPVTETPALA